jgi:hypothetical protein
LRFTLISVVTSISAANTLPLLICVIALSACSLILEQTIVVAQLFCINSFVIVNPVPLDPVTTATLSFGNNDILSQAFLYFYIEFYHHFTG